MIDCEPCADGRTGYWRGLAPPRGCLLTTAVTQLTLGSVVYTNYWLEAILETPPQANGLIELAQNLIAAKMDIAVGSDPAPIAATSSSRCRSRSSHSASASWMASSSRLKRPLSIARFIKARWSGVSSTFMASR